jgi:conjugative transfer signal peptidase TraF
VAERHGSLLATASAAPRRGRLTFRQLSVWAGAIGFGAGLILSSIAAPPAPRLVWNASASAPLGLYRVVAGDRLRIGDMVVAEPPQPIRMLAAQRHYIPANVPLVKRVAAVAGAHICAVGATIFVDGRVAAQRLATDPHGRQLPWWHGCQQLGPGESLLLNARPNSFDGRYFGPVGAAAIVGKAVPLWLR